MHQMRVAIHPKKGIFNTMRCGSEDSGNGSLQTDLRECMVPKRIRCSSSTRVYPSGSPANCRGKDKFRFRLNNLSITGSPDGGIFLYSTVRKTHKYPVFLLEVFPLCPCRVRVLIGVRLSAKSIG
jgi:hypothetical protein